MLKGDITPQLKTILDNIANKVNKTVVNNDYNTNIDNNGTYINIVLSKLLEQLGNVYIGENGVFINNINAIQLSTIYNATTENGNIALTKNYLRLDNNGLFLNGLPIPSITENAKATSLDFNTTDRYYHFTINDFLEIEIGLTSGGGDNQQKNFYHPFAHIPLVIVTGGKTGGGGDDYPYIVTSQPPTTTYFKISGGSAQNRLGYIAIGRKV